MLRSRDATGRITGRAAPSCMQSRVPHPAGREEGPVLRVREPARSGAVATVAEIVRDFTDPYLELLRLLREAAEIEHALMVQYLYASFSIRPVYRARLAGTGFFGTDRNLLGVAVQEMHHLNSVNQLLVALGATPCLIRQDFPYEPDIYPFPFELEPLTRRSVAKYTWAEAPAAALDPDGGGSLLAQLRDVLGEDLRPNHLGSIYGTMIERLTETAADPPPSFPDLTLWTERLEEIKGEGEVAHFEFFRSVFLGTHTAFPQGVEVWSLDPSDGRYPSLPLPTNPSALVTGDPDDPRRITDEPSRRLAWLGDLHYWVVLMLLDLSYRHGAPSSALAVEHMVDALRPLGFALADRGHGLAFDPLSMGYAPGVDQAGSIVVLRRLATELTAAAEALAAEGLLPGDYRTDLGPSTVTALGGM
jgi:hypothetical protein